MPSRALAMSQVYSSCFALGGCCMRVVLLLAFAILASSPMSSQTEKMEASNKKSGASGKASAPSSAGFARLADQFMKESLALSPVSASQAGYHVHGQGKA